MKGKKVSVIGAGFSGLSAAAYMAKKGHHVTVYEKNSTIGGRARQFTQNGYTFDMGPSWYWMPDVFESFFSDFSYKAEDFYQLKRLSPAFDMVFGKQDTLSVPNDYEELKKLIELMEPGSSSKLDAFMRKAKEKYDISFTNLIEQPGISITEYLNPETISSALRLSIFTSYKKEVDRHFKNPKIRALMEFPVLFLGAMPKDTPALYSLMNYAGLVLGTWYPKGGFFSVIKAMEKICLELGVTFRANASVDKIIVGRQKVVGLQMDKEIVPTDGVITSADYHHSESKLLDEKYRNYKDTYWRKKTFAPSSLIFYLGIDKKIDKLAHHTLFFEHDYEQHANQIYKEKAWPNKPLFYVCAPSKTDDTVAPAGGENLFILMPIATGLKDTETLRKRYFHLIVDRIEKHIDTNIRENIVVKKSYCINDFITDYNAYGGNAYGLANTLNQTAIFKPKMVNKKLKNLLYTGQLTVPGPGVPPSLISGKIAAKILHQHLNS